MTGKAKNEPQSYGSSPEWVSGKTGQKVNEQAAPSDGSHADFYDNRRDSERSAGDQGGQSANSTDAGIVDRVDEGDEGAKGVTVEESGAKRDSYFRKRDY